MLVKGIEVVKVYGFQVMYYVQLCNIRAIPTYRVYRLYIIVYVQLCMRTPRARDHHYLL